VDFIRLGWKKKLGHPWNPLFLEVKILLPYGKIFTLISMPKPASLEMKVKTITYYFDLNLSIRNIAEKLGLAKSTVGRIVMNHRKRKDLSRKSGSGRKISLNIGDQEFILKAVNKNPGYSARKIALELETRREKTVDRKTVSNFLNKMGFRSRIRCRKPLLSKKNKEKRFAVANRWIHYPSTYWNNVIFSDECKFNIFSSDGKERVWRKDGTRFLNKHLKPTVKFGGGSVMTWGCIAINGVGKLVIIDGIMDRFVYHRILVENLKQSAAELGMDQFIFQQDNDPKHTSRLMKEYFMENNINVLEWPAQSPDLNPIEHIWSWMKQQLSQIGIKDKADLKNKLMALWKEIPPDLLKNVVNSMTKRISAVISAKGGHISDLSEYTPPLPF
jgi:transposase